MPNPSETATADPRPGLSRQILDLDSRYWIVNIMEMFERLAYFGVRTVVPLYMVLPRELGGPEFNHIAKGFIFAWWAGVQSILPMFTGGYADRYGHKNTVALAIVLKIIGYVMMAYCLEFWSFFAGCMFLAAGTAIFKPGVQGTLVTTLNSSNASVGWGMFYQLVNVGGFLGPVIAGVLRIMDWKYVFLSCAAIVSINFLWLPFYEDPSKHFRKTEGLANPWRVFWTSIKGIAQPRLAIFCLVFSGFWLMANQFFDLLPNTIDDWVDSSGVLAAVGGAFAVPAVPPLLALVLGILYGGVCAAGVLLAMRPDRKTVTEVNNGAYLVVAIALGGALFPALSYVTTGSEQLLVPLVALGLAGLLRLLRVPAKPLGWSVFAVAAVGSFFALSQMFRGSAQQLISMAEAGEQINPEWLVNLNAALIVFTMVFFAYLSSFMRPLTSIIVGMILATIGCFAAGTAAIGLICALGIVVFSMGEMLSSPKMLEYFGSLAPKGQEGLYMGYANMPVAIGWIVGNIYAGQRYEAIGDKVNLAKEHMVNVLDMAPAKVEALPKSEVMEVLANKLDMSVLEAQRLLFDTYQPQWIWYEIAAIGLVSVIGMFLYDRAIRYYDRKKEAAEQAAE